HVVQKKQHTNNDQQDRSQHLYRPFLMLLQQPHTKKNQTHGPEPCNAVQIEYIEIAEQVEATYDHQSDASPKFAIPHVSELLLQPIDRRFKHHTLGAQHSFLCRVIRLERHVEIEPCACQAKQRGIGRIGE